MSLILWSVRLLPLPPYFSSQRTKHREDLHVAHISSGAHHPPPIRSWNSLRLLTCVPLSLFSSPPNFSSSSPACVHLQLPGARPVTPLMQKHPLDLLCNSSKCGLLLFPFPPSTCLPSAPSFLCHLLSSHLLLLLSLASPFIFSHAPFAPLFLCSSCCLPIASISTEPPLWQVVSS